MNLRTSYLLAALLTLICPAHPQTSPAQEAPIRLDDVIAFTNTHPLTFPADSVTTSAFLAERELWAKRVFLPALRAELGQSLADPEAAAAVEKLVAWWGRSGHDFSAIGRGGFDGMWWAWRAESADKAMHSLAGKLQAIVPLEAPLPATQFFLASLLYATGETAEGVTRLRAAVKGGRSAQCPPFLTALAAIQSFSVRPRSPDREVEFDTLLEFLAKALAKDQVVPGDAPFVVDTIVARSALRMLPGAATRIAGIFEQSALPEWARLTLAGYCHLLPVSALRASSPEAAPSYQRARDLFARAWKANPARPEAAAGMVRVAFGGHAPTGEDMRFWFDRATAAQCDYAGAYEQMLIGLQPQHGGSYSKLLGFGLACAKTGRFDTDVPDYLPITLALIMRSLPDWRLPCRHPEIRARVIETLQARIAASESADLKQHYQGMGFAWGWITGDFKTAAENLHALRPPGAETFFWPRATNHLIANFQADPNRMMDESLALGQQDSSKVRAAHDAAEDGDFTKAAELAHAELSASPKPQHTDWLYALRDNNHFLENFAKGGWTKLPARSGSWHRDLMGSEHRGARSLKFATRSPYAAKRCFRPELGTRFEVRGEIRLPEGQSTIGFLFGHHSEFCADLTFDWLEFRLSTKDRKTSAFQFGPKSQITRLPQQAGPAIGETIQFRLLRNRDRISCWINDTAILDAREIPAELSGGPCAFGIRGSTHGSEHPISFEKLEARALGDNG